MIIFMYFSFTSLTTIGFGDFNPRGDFERLYISFGLLFGVAIFSYVMGLFIEIIEEDKNNNAAPGDGDGLAKFFGILRHYNMEEHMEINMKQRVETYFDYRWDNDKNDVVNNEEYLGFMQQLPQYVQDNLLNEFLYKDFLVDYKSSTFYYPKVNSKVKHCCFSYDDASYREFMFKILCNLEPINYEESTILFEELDEFNSVIFLQKKAFFKVGFLLNKKPIYKIRLNVHEVGAYGITFDQKSSFIYKTYGPCEAFFIRK